MAKTEVVLFAEDDGSCPLIDWMDGLPLKARDKCVVRVERLVEMGHDLRRPEADFLRGGIYELRVALSGIQYRMLYFFNEKQAVISHGLIKKDKEVPRKEIDLAIERRNRFAMDPLKHTYVE
jgi:phage-related protein